LKLSFHGAARGVTGSCYLVECAGRRVLIDCGMFQGGRELEEENADPFGFDPTGIEFVLLTHAHLDHCGRLPLLVRRGFRGEIIATTPTRELARLVMLDAANLQEEDARHSMRRAARRGRERDAVGPLYSVLDAMNTQDAFGRLAVYGEALQIAPGIGATFLDAGHILGSASILLELQEPAGDRRRLLFSGDLGNAGRPLLCVPAQAPRADAVVLETTYGDRLHRPVAASVEELYQAVNDAFERGGNVVIPTFALERAQELLFFLRAGVELGRLSRSTQVFLDSPMAISATAIFQRHPGFCGAGTAELFREGRDPFWLPGLHFTRESSESMAINRIVAGAVIMAGSGMCTGGRIRHHLKNNLAREHCSVVFVGYAGERTLARRIIDGARSVHIFGEEVAVRAHVYTINGFSAHADQAELLAWHAQAQAARTFLVHGEEPAMLAFAQHLPGQSVERPVLHQQYEL
jgi:metallo-beta-lactamase family protein